jgi:spore coat polysaccharide biosynthesis protein SpsF
MASSTRPVWAVVAGRMGSSRMPGKTLALLAGKPSLAHIIKRLERVPSLDGIVVATTTEREDDVISECAQSMAVPVYRGSAEDVLGRMLGAAKLVGAVTTVRICGDCPLTDPAVVEAVIAAFLRDRPDFASTCLDGFKYPIGIAAEVFPTALLEMAAHSTTAPRDREHVTLFFEEHPQRFRLLSVEPSAERHRRPDLRLTLDTPSDYELISALYDALYETDPCFGLEAILAHIERHPELAALNSHVPQVMP